MNLSCAPAFCISLISLKCHFDFILTKEVTPAHPPAPVFHVFPLSSSALLSPSRLWSSTRLSSLSLSLPLRPPDSSHLVLPGKAKWAPTCSSWILELFHLFLKDFSNAVNQYYIFCNVLNWLNFLFFLFYFTTLNV